MKLDEIANVRYLSQLDTALYKKGGKKATKGKARGKRQGGGA